MRYVVLFIVVLFLVGCDASLLRKKPAGMVALQARQKQENTITTQDVRHAAKYPNPNIAYPVAPIEGVIRTVFLKNVIKNPQIIVGDYTYYDDPEDIYNFERNVLYLFESMPDKLIIGKFCQIASGVRFIMNGANHAMEGISTYPFKAFGGAWQKASMNVISKGDTVIGNDVWIGNSVTIMPGINIGHGAIIGTNSLVTKDVEPYTIVGGNPAKVIRKRFDEKSIKFLLKLNWWDWPIEKITDNLVAITTGDMKALRQTYRNGRHIQMNDE